MGKQVKWSASQTKKRATEGKKGGAVKIFRWQMPSPKPHNYEHRGDYNKYRRNHVLCNRGWWCPGCIFKVYASTYNQKRNQRDVLDTPNK